MKKIFLGLVAFSLFAMSAVTSASAQVADRLVVNVPFKFTVRDKTLPAGRYVIKPVDSIPDGALEIRGLDGAKGIFVLTEAAHALSEPQQTEMIFNKVGDKYYLFEIFEQGNSAGVELEKSHLEKRLEKEGAVSQNQSFTLIEQNAVQVGNEK
jgi:hypothetical protein